MSDLNSAAPAPLKSLTTKIISPQNIAVEARQKRAEPLKYGERRRFQRRIRKIKRELIRAQYPELQAVKKALKRGLEPLDERYFDLLAKQEAGEDVSEALRTLNDARDPKLLQLNALKRQLAPMEAKHKEMIGLQHKLNDHPMAVARLREEKRLREALNKEVMIYAGMIIARWTRLNFCHRYTKDGKERVDEVSFSNIGVTLDAIYYKINTSHKTAFNNWVMDLPEGVYVAKHLLAPETLQELTIVCQKQVTGLYNSDGAWVVVHRLESVDGLMNFVKYADVMQRYPQHLKKRMPIPVGVSYNREIQWYNLSDYPHWLIGGYTGSGKSNTINASLCSLISTQTPEDLRVVLCDLKGGLEFSFYEGIPHLHGAIVDSPENVADTLQELQSIMLLRFKKFRGVAKKIEDYHLKRPNDAMPRILCVFDEVASIQGHGDITKRIVAALLDLSRRGRAVGIHLWLCTQQPNVRVIEGGIKTNMNLRLSGRMPSTSDSITVLGNSSAAQLAAIAGRMIVQAGPDPVPIQTPYISDEEIAAALEAAKRMEVPLPLDVGEVQKVIHEEWTPERIIRFALTHMNGLVSGRRIWESIGDDSLGLPTANKLVEAVWAMAPLQFEGKTYKIEKRRGGARYLVEVPEDAKLQATGDIPLLAP